MITRYVGVGGDYSDWNAAYAAMYAVHPLTDDWELVQVSDLVNSTDVSGVGFSFFMPNYHSVTYRSENPCNGSFNSGYKTTVTATLLLSPFTHDYLYDPRANGFVRITGLNIFSNSVQNMFQLRVGHSPNPALQLATVDNCFLTNINAADSSTALNFIGYSTALIRVYNVKTYTTGNSSIGISFTPNGTFGVSPASSRFKYLENIATYGNGVSCRSVSANFDYQCYATLKNIVSAGGEFIFGVTTGVHPIADVWTVSNCAAPDSSLIYGTDNFSNIVPANEFQSLIYTDDEFLKLNKGRLVSLPLVDPSKGYAPLKTRFEANAAYLFNNMVLPDGGINPIYSERDIAGEVYGEYGMYPIGCHNAEIAY